MGGDDIFSPFPPLLSARDNACCHCGVPAGNGVWRDTIREQMSSTLHPPNTSLTFRSRGQKQRRKSPPGLPWWRSGWESACQCRGHGFKPWSGRIPHATEQLGPWATTAEPARLELVLCSKRGRNTERPAHRHEEWPPLAASRKSPRTETKTQCSQK